MGQDANPKILFRGNKVKEVPAYKPNEVYEIIDSRELARRWRLPESWVRNHVRPAYLSRNGREPIPHLKLGAYVRFEWNSPALNTWFAKGRVR